MKSTILSIFCLIAFTSVSLAQEQTAAEALVTINKLIKENDTSKGFHALDLLAYKEMGDKAKIKADKTHIYCEQKINEKKTKDRTFAHVDIKKMVVLKGEKAKYGANYVDDFQILIHYKQMGKLVIVGIDTDNLEPFIEAVKSIAPNIKKVTYAK